MNEKAKHPRSLPSKLEIEDIGLTGARGAEARRRMEGGIIEAKATRKWRFAFLRCFWRQIYEKKRVRGQREGVRKLSPRLLT
jgi:hypothetical protein